MKRTYANLLGVWVDITNTGTVADLQKPAIYFEENLTYEGGSKIAKRFEYDYIHVQYNGKDYQIHPSMIQIVTE